MVDHAGGGIYRGQQAIGLIGLEKKKKCVWRAAI
jgi:hypothetical protein